MPQLLATASLILVIAALSVFTPLLKQGRPSSFPGDPLTPVPPAASGTDPISRLAIALRTRPLARVAVTTLSIGLLVGAVGTVSYPFYTNLMQDRIQSRLDRQLLSAELKQAYLSRNVGIGDSLTRIAIPDINIDVVVVEGVSSSALRAGAGHYPTTPLPCEIGNVGIAGHRTTYGRPFYNLDLLKPGAEITLTTPIGSCTYKVTRDPFVVSPTDPFVLAPVPDEAVLTLTTCNPKGSARQRLIVRATLVRSDVESAAA